MQIKNKWLYALPSIIAFFVYWPTAYYGYVWDDASFLQNSARFKSWDIFINSLHEPFLNSDIYFRPLVLVMYAIERWLGDGDASILHIVNIVLHCSNVAMVTYLAKLMWARIADSNDIFPALIAGLLYALHPAIVEAVAWISGRFDLAFTFFALAFLIIDARYSDGPGKSIAMGLVYLLAALCKEMAVGLALLLPVWHLMWAKENHGTNPVTHLKALIAKWSIYAAVCISGVFYLLIRYYFLGGMHLSSEGGDMAAFMARLAFIFKTSGLLLILCVWPFSHTSPIHSVLEGFSFTDPKVIIGMFFFIAGILIAILGFMRRINPLLFLVPCALFAFLPVLQIATLPIGESYASDRFVTFPAVFICLLISGATYSLTNKKIGTKLHNWILLAPVLMWLVLGYLNVSVTVPLWRDNLSLWTYARMKNPDSPTVGNNLLSAYLENNQYDLAHKLAEEIREKQGGQFIYGQQITYAILLSITGDKSEAINYMKGAIPAIPPWDKLSRHAAYTSLGTIYLDMGDLSEAIRYYTMAEAETKNETQVMFMHGVALMAAGNTVEGQNLIDESIKLSDEASRSTRMMSYKTLVAEAQKKAAAKAEMHK